MNSSLQYITQVQEINEQIGFPLANVTSNERLSGFHIPVGLVHPKKQSVRKRYEGGTNAIPTPMYIPTGQYGGTVNHDVMNHLLEAVKPKQG